MTTETRVKIRVLRETTEPSTGHTLLVGHTLYVDDGDAAALLRAGVVEETDAAPTEDVGALLVLRGVK